MDDLVKFLRARLDEDEQAARGTGKPLAWHQGPGDDPEWTNDEMVLMWPPEHHTPYEQDKHWRGLDVDGPGLAAHIARHDPARVLAAVDAQRRLLALHRRDTSHLFSGCVVCDAGDNSCGCMGGSAYDYPCETLRVLALPYRNHPDYLPEWAPDPA
ncbi:DUF6221 family protein [Streptomyces virginiae]|uniref:DUF6221 family protein n=1 Tax=Streptomyces virginiae TaxID=1961 RepID=UPI00365E040E